MLSLFITAAAWIALLMTVSGVVLLMLRPRPGQAQQLIAIQVIGAVSGILITVSILARADLSLSIPFTLLGLVLAILAAALRIRYRSL